MFLGVNNIMLYISILLIILKNAVKKHSKYLQNWNYQTTFATHLRENVALNKE